MIYLEKKLKFLDEYRFFRRKGFTRYKGAKRAWENVQESKRIIKRQNDAKSA